MSHIFKLKQNWISGSTSHKRLSKWEETTCTFEWTIFLLDGCPSRSSSRLYSFFSIYNNELPDKLNPNPKLFTDNTSLFSTVRDSNATANQINNDLHNINTWAYHWKANFNPGTSKQTQKVIFSRKIKVTAHLSLFLTIIQCMKPKLKSILECFLISS